MDASAIRAPTRVRYELKRRELRVASVTRLTPHMIRIGLTGSDLEGFQSLAFDDHVKLFFPDPVTGVLTLPVLGPAGVVPPEPGTPKPIARDYTPRRFDKAFGMLEIDFALHGIGHEAGPATQWAMTAEVGDTLHVGGPKASTLLPDYDAYVLIGDDTALPAIGRQLEELPAGVRAVVVAEVDTAADEMTFATKADTTIHWVYRQAVWGAHTLNNALHGLYLPQGDVHVWVACEAAQAKLIRTQLIDDHGINPKAIKAAGYWHLGQGGVDKVVLD